MAVLVTGLLCSENATSRLLIQHIFVLTVEANTIPRALKPGGKVEVSEMRTRLFCDDGTFPADSETNLLVVCFLEFFLSLT